MKMKQQRHLITFLVLCFYIVSSSTSSVSIHKSNEVDRLNDFLKSKRLHDRFAKHSNGQRNFHEFPSSSSVYIRPQAGLAEVDKIRTLPGQPKGVEFEHYSGYVTVDREAGRALFYYFVESPQDSSIKPLVLWLNGGPGCSSFGNGAMKELGPFRVNSDGKTLFLNEYAWSNVANVIFLESPAGVGFSYSNRSSDYYVGDTRTAEDAYIFLVNWLERFPQYKTRDFYITGESYAGHYVPQLANTILRYNNNTESVINLKGIAIGNALIDGPTRYGGIADFLWSHALNSDETNKGLHKYCDFANGTYSDKCDYFSQQSDEEIGNIYFYDIYAPLCFSTSSKNGSAGSVHDFDPCSDDYIYSYLNQHQVQTALHANYTTWESCSYVVDWDWDDSPNTILPIIENLMRNNITVWIYSGDTDRAIPVTSTRYAINSMKLPIKTSWRPWYTNNEVGGYVVGYEGLTFVTVRGAGHFVPSYQPERALTMFSSFLQGLLPPAANP